mmetsp:Transcript_59999/g.83354  ORF Transcript_59999/g.83354 Transcript_59999/m.83354 type:complete len:194 (+) Transcript_59999:30-611(+)
MALAMDLNMHISFFQANPTLLAARREGLQRNLFDKYGLPVLDVQAPMPAVLGDSDEHPDSVCPFCRGCHNGRVKPDKKQRATVKSMSEAQLLDLLLAQLSMRAQEAGCFDTLFPVLQAIHRRLSVSSTGESNISGASLRNLDKMISKMSCQQMMFFAKKNPNTDPGLLQLVMDRLTSSSANTPVSFPASSVWL